MKRIATIGLLVVVSSFVSIMVYDKLTSEEPEDDGVIVASFYSKILGEERELIVHLPRDYDSTRSYPVAYVLDGSSQDGHIADKFDVLSSAGYAPRVIVVGIPNMTAESRQMNLVPPFLKTDVEDVNSPFGTADKFLSFVDAELIPFVEKRYAASKTRLFMGNSRAGLAVMYSLIHKPEMFQARFCFSTPFWRQDNVMSSKVGEFLGSRDTLRSFVFMSAGEKETENMRSGLDSMAALFRQHTPVGFVWHSELTPNADHQSNAEISAAAGIARWGEFLRP